MRTVKQICGDGCMTVTEGTWYWLLALWIASHLPISFKAWTWVYDHTSESAWQPGHSGQDICHKCGRDRQERGEELVPYYRAELVPCETCTDRGQTNG